MTFSIEIGSNNAENISAINNLDRNMRRGIRKGFYAVGSQLNHTARSQMLEKKSGELYRVPGRRRKVRASAPGESPANRTKKLRRSLGFQVSGADSMQFGAGGRSSGVEYATYLEEGTPFMQPRPLLGNAVNANEATIQNLFQSAMARSISS